MRLKGGTYLIYFKRAAQSVFAILMLYMMLPTVVFAEQSEEEKNFLLMYFKEEELQVVSSTRSIKSISRVAENMTVVTAQDIERMNAHTLADVLNTVNGVQVWFVGATPGNLAQVSIQGSENRHALVLIDGIVLNNLSDNVIDVGSIPLQNIEKIEIIKGPASSVWGSALGGVINIITKNPPDSGVHGTGSASYGWKNTGDYRAEISGKKGAAGFYLSAGRLNSNGLRRLTDFGGNNFYTKLTYDISNDTNLVYTLSYRKGERGEGDFSALGYDLEGRDKFENYFSTLSLNSRLSRELDLNISIKAQRQRSTVYNTMLSTGEDLGTQLFDDRRYGGSAKLVWKPENHAIVIGTDYDNGSLVSNTILDGEQHLRKWAGFVNDTITLGKFAITPGLRYESTDTNGDFASPSLGATYQLTKKTILRANISRGFNIPPLSYTFGDGLFFVHNSNLKPEKVWSYQVGAESGELKYVWVKISLFRHDLRDALIPEALPDGTAMYVNGGRERRQGFEAEMRTIPVYNVSFSAGTTFVDARDLDTHEVIKEVPRYTYDVALTYDNKKSFNAILKGHYIWWNANDVTQSKYSAFIIDLNLNKVLFKHNDQSLEAFVTVHNLFDGRQYMWASYMNSGRWAEGGLRFKF